MLICAGAGARNPHSSSNTAKMKLNTACVCIQSPTGPWYSSGILLVQGPVSGFWPSPLSSSHGMHPRVTRLSQRPAVVSICVQLPNTSLDFQGSTQRPDSQVALLLQAAQSAAVLACMHACMSGPHARGRCGLCQPRCSHHGLLACMHASGHHGARQCHTMPGCAVPACSTNATPPVCAAPHSMRAGKACNALAPP